MLMRNHPLLVNFAEANGRAPPQIELSSSVLVALTRLRLCDSFRRARSQTPHSCFAEREPGSPINSGAAGGLWARTKVS